MLSALLSQPKNQVKQPYPQTAGSQPSSTPQAGEPRKTPRDVPLLRHDMHFLIPGVLVAKIPSQAQDINAMFPHTLMYELARITTSETLLRGWSVYDNGLRTLTYMHTNFIVRAIHSAQNITAGDNDPLVLYSFAYLWLVKAREEDVAGHWDHHHGND
ncbi:hypothetical protein HYALB_00012554 [Hymenoscyphus albidus]|uniref:Uncharacterized protein n=1 Tax=Hymenoscyphus albidus TaxID=595503 RepID=A0A9N9LUF7_9HELO|nr:hypothetical protein HYALB_00012554 [Hymenoscyphus albidus]